MSLIHKPTNNYPSTYTYQPEGLYGMHRPPVVLPTDGHPPEWMEQLIGRISTWVAGGFWDLNDTFTPSQLEYLKKHMVYYEDTLSRVEFPQFFEESGLKEGDTLNSDKLRSFTKDPAIELFGNGLTHDYSEGVVVYRVKGVPMFDVEPINNDHGERESFVNMSNLKISKVTTINDSNPDVRLEKYLDISPSESDGWGAIVPKEITVIELDYTGKIPSEKYIPKRNSSDWDNFI